MKLVCDENDLLQNVRYCGKSQFASLTAFCPTFKWLRKVRKVELAKVKSKLQRCREKIYLQNINHSKYLQ